MVGMVWYGMVWHDLLPCGLLHAGGPHQAGPQQSYREVQAAGGGDGEWIDLRSAARGNYLKMPTNNTIHDLKCGFIPKRFHYNFF